MTVKELIVELQKLDQEKGIWVVYDGFIAFPPIPDKKAEKRDICSEHFTFEPNDALIQIGDYIIEAN